jgi:cell division protein FtsB
MESSKDFTNIVNMGTMRLLLDLCKGLIVRVDMCDAKIAEQQRQIDAMQAQMQILQNQIQLLQREDQQV